MVIIHVRLRDGSDDDIAAWYAEQDDKSAEVRAAIRAYRRMQNGESQRAAIAEAVTQAMGSELIRLRGAVAAAVQEALDAYQFAPREQEVSGEEDPELAARLDAQIGEFFEEGGDSL